jgi:4-hydroxybenzoate polyprenyltransferase
VLDGFVAAALALVAGASLALATTLGLGMTALQFGIGAVNDLVDVSRDARSKPGKPIPSGLVDPGVARIVAAASFALGLVLSAFVGQSTLLIAVIVAGIGLAYDLVLKGTRWSWVGFAVGIPLLPVYAWLGATGSLPLAFAVLVPAAVASGAGLALANGLADAERDRSAGVDSVVGSLGAARAITASRLLQGGVAIAALVSLAALGGLDSLGPNIALVVVGIASVQVGIALTADPSADRRERGWELQAVGVGALAVGWVASLLGAGAL